MKTIVSLILLVVAVALALRLGYINGRADGWQLGQNDIKTVFEFRDNLGVTASKPTPEAVAKAWGRATAAAADRDGAWMSRHIWQRLETPAPLWKHSEAPIAFVGSRDAPPVPGKVSIFPFSSMEIGKAKP